MLTMHPAIKPCISERGKFVDLFDFMQNGGWWIVDLSEDQLKPELQQGLAQLFQYLLKVCTLRRQRMQEKPFFLAVFDEYQQYACSTTHTSLLKLGRSQNVGAALLCQDVGGFSDAELLVLGGCGTFVAFSCEYKSAVDMVHLIFEPKGQTYKDWKSERINSVRDEIDQYCVLVGEQEPGEAICRVKPGKAHFLEVPWIEDPKVAPETVYAFREAVAKRWYRPKHK